MPIDATKPYDDNNVFARILKGVRRRAVLYCRVSLGVGGAWGRARATLCAP